MNEIEMLLCKVLDCGRADLYLEKERPPFSGKELAELERFLSRRLTRGEPLQYVMREAYFMGHCFEVMPGVLIPRPETEILVEETLLEIKRMDTPPLRLLDIGTGSGNIVISLARALPEAAVTFFAADISGTALAVARANAENNGVADKITFLTSDLFACFKGHGALFDVIVSNPPYIPEARLETLPATVLAEPPQALSGGADGLDFYRRIEEGARRRLRSGGVMLLEIGDDQARGIQKIFSDAALWKMERAVRDLNNRDRVVVIKKMPEKDFPGDA